MGWEVGWVGWVGWGVLDGLQVVAIRSTVGEVLEWDENSNCQPSM